MAFSLKDILKQADIGKSRSSIVNPLQWALVILIVGIALFLLAGAPSWLIVEFAAMVAVVFVLMMVAFDILWSRPQVLCGLKALISRNTK
jgi:hypothetical protein